MLCLQILLMRVVEVNVFHYVNSYLLEESQESERREYTNPS